jgi:hypothetical protein
VAPPKRLQLLLFPLKKCLKQLLHLNCLARLLRRSWSRSQSRRGPCQTGPKAGSMGSGWCCVRMVSTRWEMSVGSVRTSLGDMMLR